MWKSAYVGVYQLSHEHCLMNIGRHLLCGNMRMQALFVK